MVGQHQISADFSNDTCVMLRLQCGFQVRIFSSSVRVSKLQPTGESLDLHLGRVSHQARQESAPESLGRNR